MVNLGPLAVEIVSLVWAPQQIRRVSRLGSVTARHSTSGRQPNCSVEQRVRHVFGRAAITLGINWPTFLVLTGIMGHKRQKNLNLYPQNELLGPPPITPYNDDNSTYVDGDQRYLAANDKLSVLLFGCAQQEQVVELHTATTVSDSSMSRDQGGPRIF